MDIRSAAVAIAALVSVSASTAAQPTLLSQQRLVRAGSTTESAAGFSLFDQVLDIEGSDCDGNCIPSSAFVSQISEITTEGFFVDATCDAFGGSDSGIFAENKFEFEFEVAVATTLTLTGSIQGGLGGFDPPGTTTASVFVDLVADGSIGGAQLGSWVADGFNGVVNIDEAFELAPGPYRFKVGSTADGGAQDGGVATFDIAGTFEASTSCPADLTGDEIVDLADIQLFIESFVAQEPAGDFNADGIYDLADIQAFVTAFVAGCP